MDIPDTPKHKDNQLYPYFDFTQEQWYLLELFQDYCSDYLRFIPRTLPDYSSHGIDHTIRIIRNINAFIQGWKLTLTQDEALLLYIAAWAHDIGCIRDRDTHQDVSVELFTSAENLQPLEETFTYCLSKIIVAHRKRFPLSSVPETYGGVRLQLLCAIFRLMDGCEITFRRTPKVVFEEIKSKMEQESVKIWQEHMSIREIGYKAPAILVDVTDDEVCAEMIKDLKEEVKTVQDTFANHQLEVPHVELRVYEKY